MLNHLALAKIACRASNLSDRLLIAQNLANTNALKYCHHKVSSIEAWVLDRLVGKLAVIEVKQNIYQSKISIPTLDELHKLLTDYKIYECNLENLPYTELLKLTHPHTEWLNVYQQALATIELPHINFEKSIWYEPNIYYGRFAKVCEPFLRYLEQTLNPICTAINKNVTNCFIDEQCIADVQLELLHRFEMMLARAVEASINVYCYQNNLAKSSDIPAYIAYLQQTFNDELSYHKFYCQFPVLGRWLADVTRFFSNNIQELLQRLTNDLTDINTTFFASKNITRIKSLKLGQSDYHAKGCSVVMVELELLNFDEIKQTETIVYKPRCLKTEAALQNLLKTLNQAEIAHFADYKVLCKTGYGYVEFIRAGKNNAQNEKDIERFYNQLGGYLAIFHILGGSDMHYENIIAANCNAFICDCETILEVVPCGMEQAHNTVFDSIFKTGMLEWPRSNAFNNKQVNVTGFSGGESYEVPFAIPQITQRMSLALAVENKVGITVEVESKNRIFYKGELVRPQDYQQHIVNGFSQVYSWVQHNKTQTIKLIEELFASSSIRFVNRATQIYAHLINAAQHAKSLAEALEVDLAFYSLVEHPRLWDEMGQLAEQEIVALWQLDIPVFTAIANSRDLVCNQKQLLSATLAISPLENVVRRIQQLSQENQIRQTQYIYSSLCAGEINNEYFISSSVNYAYQIGMELYSLLQEPSSSAPWKTCEYTLTGKKITDVSSCLYSGSAGICLFLAYLDAIHPQAEIRSSAQRALDHAIGQRNPTTIGAYLGTAGLIYLLTHLAQLWNKPEMLLQASELCDELTQHIEQDDYYDIMHGVAGIIPVMLGLAQFTSGKGIAQAQQCAEHLLASAVYQDDTISWPFNPELAQASLTGFSHGASGIGWALINLGCHTNQPKYIAAGRQAFAYEATKFDAVARNWFDLRTSMMTKQTKAPKFTYFWCNGSTGIGLSRISSWAALGKTDDDMLQEAYVALDTTIRSFNKLDNDALCHGKAGNAELLLRFSQLAEQPYLQMEANIQATAQWRRYEKARHWTCSASGNDVFPGLMTGLAGIGMHFLRLAYPDKIPSPLLLDPPSRELLV